MPTHESAPAHQEQGRTRLHIGDIFRRYGPAYRKRHRVTEAQAKVMRAIEACRTPLLGGHRRVCDDCGVVTDQFNSCRNRHCPTCQAIPQAIWIANRQRRVLPVRHFHVVFTLPAQLRGVVHLNREPAYSLLLRAAAQTLLELGGDPRRLGVQLGVSAVLHTWTRELQFHPHAHCIVTAGGLAVKGSQRWLHVEGDYLFPVLVLSRLFRAKYMAGLEKLYDAGGLILWPERDEPQSQAHWRRLKDELFGLDWNAYCKRPLGGAEHLFKYLGRYTHRVGISDARLISYGDSGVCFATKDGNSITLPPDEFIRRFLQHVLPHGFIKIRHYGLMASGNVNGRLQTARRLLTPAETTENGDVDTGVPDILDVPWQEILKQLMGIDLSVCPACGSSNIRPHALARARAPPSEVR